MQYLVKQWSGNVSIRPKQGPAIKLQANVTPVPIIDSELKLLCYLNSKQLEQYAEYHRLRGIAFATGQPPPPAPDFPLGKRRGRPPKSTTTAAAAAAAAPVPPSRRPPVSARPRRVIASFDDDFEPDADDNDSSWASEDGSDVLDTRHGGGGRGGGGGQSGGAGAGGRPLRRSGAPSFPVQQHIIPGMLYPGLQPDNCGTGPQGAYMTAPEAAEWFSLAAVHSIERLALPAWLQAEAPPAGAPEPASDLAYRHCRNFVVLSFRRTPQVWLAFSAIRRTYPSDAGKLYQLYQFLVRKGIINYGMAPPLHLDHPHTSNDHPLAPPLSSENLPPAPAPAAAAPAPAPAAGAARACPWRPPAPASAPPVQPAMLAPFTHAHLAFSRRGAVEPFVRRRPGRPSAADRRAAALAVQAGKAAAAAGGETQICSVCGVERLAKRRWMVSATNVCDFACEKCATNDTSAWVPIMPGDSISQLAHEAAYEHNLHEPGSGFTRDEVLRIFGSLRVDSSLSAAALAAGHARTPAQVAAALIRMPFLDALLHENGVTGDLIAHLSGDAPSPAPASEREVELAWTFEQTQKCSENAITNAVNSVLSSLN